jgi:tRNA-modifying protein YgfZ
MTVLIHNYSIFKSTHKDRMIPGRDNQSMQTSLPMQQTLSLPVCALLNQAHSSATSTDAGPLGIIRAQGADTVKFLQGQLTQDVALLGLSEARLAAWCSAKGRMLASFVVFKITHEDIVLICSTSVLPATLKRLQMFVLRAQCKLSDATRAFVLHGLAGNTPTEGLQGATNSVAAYASNIWAAGRNGTEITVQVPPGHLLGQSVTRALRLRPVDDTMAAAAPAALAASQPALDTANAQALAFWQYLEVTSGIAPITAPVSDLYVPQMLNYESVGGVNFKKGCYPGQEVVARSQFRGTLKRRAFIVTSATEVRAGQEVFDTRDAEQPCGTVAYAAAVPEEGGRTQGTGFTAIVSMQTSAADSPRLYAAASADGMLAEATLHLQPLPYPLLADI